MAEKKPKVNENSAQKDRCGIRRRKELSSEASAIKDWIKSTQSLTRWSAECPLGWMFGTGVPTMMLGRENSVQETM